MGTQGEIYVVYGLNVDAEFISAPNGKECNPVLYKVGSRAFCDDEDLINGAEAILDKLAYDGLHYMGIHSKGYGALDPDKQELSVRVLGHSGEHSGNMGSRHFDGKALVGYAVSNASYMNGAEPVASIEKIQAVTPRLIADIEEKLGLIVRESDLGLHLVFDWLQGY